MFIRKLPTEPAHIYHTKIVTVRELFTGETGFLIPHFYAEYSWQSASVSRLVQDVCECVNELVEDLSTAHFFGLITLLQTNQNEMAITWLDPYACPRNLLVVIDGKQRLTTVALLACELYQRLELLRPLTFEEHLNTLRESIDYQMGALLRVFSFNLHTGFPWHKPVIIHGRYDSWGQHKEAGAEYRSAASRYISDFLLASAMGKEVVQQDDSNSAVQQSLQMINRYLDTIAGAHYNQTENYPTAWRIRSGLHLIDRPLFGHAEIAAAAASSGKEPSSFGSQLCSLVQYLAFTYALLDRCCFALVMPTTDSAGIDLLRTRQHDLIMRD